MARKIVVALGVLMLLIGGVLWWRATHPPLTDEQQIQANLDGLKNAAEACSADRVMNYTSEDFNWNGQKRSEVRSAITGACLSGGFHKPDFSLTFTNVHITVKGATATAAGHYQLYIRSFRGSPEPHDGEFSTEWEKRDGEWKITRASGGESMP